MNDDFTQGPGSPVEADQSFGAISRKTASFDSPNRRGYSFGGVTLQRMTHGHPPEEAQPFDDLTPKIKANMFNIDQTFEEQPSVNDIGKRQEMPIYEQVMKDKQRLDNLLIFDKLCSKEDFKKNKVCPITGQSSKLKPCSFCGEQVHTSVLTRERKDPDNPAVYHPICEKCNEEYILRQILTPFTRNCEKLRTLATNKEQEYYKLGEGFNRVYGDIQHKNLVILQKTEYTEQKIELYDRTKSEINVKLYDVNMRIKELMARERVIDEQIVNDGVVLEEIQSKLSGLNKEYDGIVEETRELDDDIKSMLDELNIGSIEMYKAREIIKYKLNGGKLTTDGNIQNATNNGKESIFSNNYAVNIQQGDRKTVLRATVAPKRNGSVQQTKPYCTLV